MSVEKSWKTTDGKMKPYMGKGKFQVKYKAASYMDQGPITKKSKLIAKNANRSLKKSERQGAKKDIQNQI